MDICIGINIYFYLFSAIIVNIDLQTYWPQGDRIFQTPRLITRPCNCHVGILFAKVQVDICQHWSEQRIGAERAFLLMYMLVIILSELYPQNLWGLVKKTSIAGRWKYI